MNQRRRGFTLVELLVCAGLVVVTLVAVHGGLFSGRKAAEKGLNYLDRLGKINRLLEHCKRAVRYATRITPGVAPGNARTYVIDYIERVEAPRLTRVENDMRILARTDRHGTKVVVKHKGKRAVYLLNDLDFHFEVDRNLATITLTPLKGNRPPIALSLFAPFLEPVSLPVGPVTSATAPPPVPPTMMTAAPPTAAPTVQTNAGQQPTAATNEVLGQSGTFGTPSPTTQRSDGTAVDGVDMANIQFTTMTATSNGTRSGNIQTLSATATSPTPVRPPVRTPPPQEQETTDEIMTMDGWTGNLGNQVTASSFTAPPPAEASTTDDDRSVEPPPRPEQYLPPLLPADAAGSRTDVADGAVASGTGDLDALFGE